MWQLSQPVQYRFSRQDYGAGRAYGVCDIAPHEKLALRRPPTLPTVETYVEAPTEVPHWSRIHTVSRTVWCVV